MIALGGDPAAFVDAIDEALSRRTPEAAARRLEVARGNSWAPRIDRMITLMADALSARA